MPDEEALAEAVRVLRSGGLVAFPTETVYGLCADAENAGAVRRLYAVKGRDAAKKCAYLLADREAALRHAPRLPPLAERIADRFWPGPVTLVVPGADPDDFVGLRVPGAGLPRALAAAAGTPLLQTSANRSGEPAALDDAGVEESLGDAVDLLLDGGRAGGAESSTVVKCTLKTFTILRQGAVSDIDVLRAATRLVLLVCTGNICRSPLGAAMLRDAVAAELGCRPRHVVRYGLRFGSFGIMAMAGRRATDHAQAVGRDHGVDLSGHRSRPFSVSLVEEASVVYCLAQGHMDFLEPYFQGGRADALQMLDPKGREIPDPYGRSLRVYRKTAERIAEAVEVRARELAGTE